MRARTTMLWFTISLVALPCVAAGQCDFDTRYTPYLLIELLDPPASLGESSFQIQMSRRGGDLRTAGADHETDRLWKSRVSGKIAICQVDLLPLLDGVEVDGPKDCAYRDVQFEGRTTVELVAWYQFDVTPAVRIGLEVDPPTLPMRMRGRSPGPPEVNEHCLPDGPDERLATGRPRDRNLAAAVREALAADRDLASFAIRVRADAGVVFLTGIVDSRELIDRAKTSAGRVAGVTRVETDLEIRPEYAGTSQLRFGAFRYKLVTPQGLESPSLPIDEEVLLRDGQWVRTRPQLENDIDRVGSDRGQGGLAREALKRHLGAVDRIVIRRLD